MIHVEKLLRIAKKETKAQRLAIENVIDRLIHEKVIVPGTRLTRKIILKNQTRRRIYMLVKKCPGVNFNSISTEKGL